MTFFTPFSRFLKKNLDLGANRRIREAGYCDEGKMEIYSDGTKRILWTFPDGCEDDLEFAYQDILKNVSAE